MPPTELNVQRVRHPLKMRLLEVKRVTRPTPHLARITLAGDALRDFVSASFDDHVKVFFPPPGAARPVLPELGPDGLVFAEGEPRPPMRDYTPRRHDARAGELDLEFVLHGEGPAASWAA
ncbi:siderophore-interacting protein, partial [Bordetella pertussis]